MNKLWLIVQQEYRVRVRSRSFIISTLLAPLFILAITVGPALLATRSSSSDHVVMVVDETGQPGLFEKLQHIVGDPAAGGSSGIHLLLYGGGGPVDSVRVRLAPAVEDGRYDGLLVLGPDFLDSGKAVFYASDPSGLMWTDAIESALDELLLRHRMAQRGVPEEDLAALMDKVHFRTAPITGEAEREGAMESRLVIGMVLILLLYMMILTYGVQSMNAVIEDKASRVVEVMLANVTPTILMSGKIVAAALVGITQFVIWGVLVVGVLGRGPAMLPAEVDLSFLTFGLWASFTIFFILGYLLFASLYAAIGSMCNSMQDAQQFQMPVTILVIVPVLLLQVVIQDPNGTLAVVFSLIPVFTPIMMFIRIAMGSPPLWQVLVSIALLAVTVALMAKLTGKLFRLSILSFGKAPSWRQVLEMLRSPE